MNTPFFSVIVVSFQAGDKLPETIGSILKQSFEDYEIIIKDAGSDDGSLEKVEPDPRIRLIRKKDNGIYDGMNQAIRCCAGSWLYFLNCGDLLYNSNVLYDVHTYISQYRETRIFYGDVLERQTGQRVMANPNMTHLAMYRYLPCHQACFYHHSLFDERSFDTDYLVRADYEHFLWCVLDKKARTRCMQLIVADYEGGGFSESAEGLRLSDMEHKVITGKYFTRAELIRFKAYLVITLQPLRRMLAQNPHTAAVYDRLKNSIYMLMRKE